MLRILALVLMVLISIEGTTIQEVDEEPTIVASTNGIAFKSHPAICLPSIFWTIRINFEYDQYLTPLIEGFLKLEQAFGQYGNAQDSENSIKIRTCANTAKINGICPLSTLKEITENAARDKNMMVEMLIDCERKINHLRKIFAQQFPSNSYIPLLQVPATQIMVQMPPNQSVLIDNLPLIQQQAVFLPMHDNRKPTVWDEVFISFRKRGENFWFPEGATAVNFSATVQDLTRDAQIAITHANMLLNELYDILQTLEENQFPLMLVEESTLQSAIETIHGRYESLFHTEDEDFSLLTQEPLTFAIQDSRCQNNEEKACERLEIVTVFPVIKSTDHFRFKEPVLFPIATETYLEHPKWEQPTINTRSKILIRSTELFTTNYEFSQNECPLHFKCRICHFTQLPQTLDDECLIKAIKGPPTVCKTESIDAPVDTAVQLDDNSWMVVDPQPGSLVQTCAAEEKVFDLPFSGIINFKDHCTYRMINGPFSRLVPYLPNSKLSSAQSPLIRFNRTKNILDDISSIQKHFRDYEHIYFIVLASLTILFGTLGTYFGCQRFQRRQRTRVRRRRQRPTERSSPLVVRSTRVNTPSVQWYPGGIRISDA